MADKLSFPEFVREFWTAEQEKASPLTGATTRWATA